MNQHRRQRSSTSNASTIVKAFVILSTLHGSSAFQNKVSSVAFRRPVSVNAAEGVDDEISRQLERAKDLLAKSKAKIEEKDLIAAEFESSQITGDSKGGVPFFASVDSNQDSKKKKEKVIKSRNEEGLFTTDGDLMAEMSESEEWEVRPLLEVFESDSKDPANDPLADRDVAASIFGLRKVLQTDDYLKIFDKRNRFIGES